MPRRQKVPFSLVRKRIRPSLNKLNIYNAATWRKNRPFNTQYRAVFFAKQETRSYHGEHLTETQFRNIFRSELTSVSPLQSKNERGDANAEIPHALQTFVALERRLDFAVFRSLFASSVRQAAKFVVGGAVKVNGVKIKEPGYVLRAGDMFSVDSNRVLEALGRQKPSVKEAVELTNKIIRKYNKHLEQCRKNPEKMWKRREVRRQRHVVFNSKFQARERRAVEAHNKSIREHMQQELADIKPKSVLEAVIKGDIKGAQKLMGHVKQVMGLVRPLLPEASDPAEAAGSVAAKIYEKQEQGGPVGKSDIKKQVAVLVQELQEQKRLKYTSQMRRSGSRPFDPTWVERLPAKLQEIDPEIELEELEKVTLALPFSTTGKVYGLAEPSKRWFTPWQPRQFIAPMAVLPHHIEVSFETCHAVYLRDPVARPGHSEVISPFNLDMHERAHMWYFYRRRKNLRPSN